VNLPYAIKLMENEEGKVEVEKIDFRFWLIHVVYIIIPCAFIEFLGVYKVEKEENKTNKMTVMGVEHVIDFLNFFTNYE
jgi:hypothetical protein